MAKAAMKNKKDQKNTKPDVNEASSITSKSAEAYNSVPYESHSFVDSHPPHLYTIGKVFGMTPKPFEKARVLELGCASGGNIIPLAEEFPEGEFLGIDISEKQIGEGEEHRKALGLDNLTLKAMDINDLDSSYGKFDYIMCHGVYSWVPEIVREKIMEICRKRMNKNGIAFVSYNVLPAWSQAKSVRDMMIYHTQQFESTAEKANQAKLLVNFLHENTTDNSPYKGILENEKNVLNRTKDYYLMHEYLEDENTAFYFHEFMEHARDNKLQYLGDSSLPSMFSGNMPPDAMEKLSGINDIVRQEQYMDFIRNRRFRKTLLVHDDVKLNRTLDKNQAFDFYIVNNLRPKADLTQNQTSVTFEDPASGKTLTTNDECTKALFGTLSKYVGQPVKLDDILGEAQADYNIEQIDQLRKIAADNVIPLVMQGILYIESEPTRWVTTLSEKPEASKLARYQAGLVNSDWVTNKRRTKVQTDSIGKVVISLADGTRTVDQIVDDTIAKIKDAGLTVRENDQVVTDPARMKSLLEEKIKTILNKSVENAIMVS